MRDRPTVCVCGLLIRPWVNWVRWVGKKTELKLGKWGVVGLGGKERRERVGDLLMLLCKSPQNGAIAVQLYFSTVHTSLTEKEERKGTPYSKGKKKKTTK